MDDMLFKIDNKKFFSACASMCMTTSSVIKSAGCSTVTQQRIVKGKPLQAVTVGKLCKVLRVKPEDLLAE